jgi:hypothetical protein
MCSRLGGTRPGSRLLAGRRGRVPGAAWVLLIDAAGAVTERLGTGLAAAAEGGSGLITCPVGGVQVQVAADQQRPAGSRVIVVGRSGCSGAPAQSL